MGYDFSLDADMTWISEMSIAGKNSFASLLFASNTTVSAGYAYEAVPSLPAWGPGPNGAPR